METLSPGTDSVLGRQLNYMSMLGDFLKNFVAFVDPTRAPLAKI